MLKTAKLVLPALIPSWRFFDTIAPSPRIEFTWLQAAHDAPEHWQEFRPRPAHLSLGGMLKRLFWNPRWNETLFLLTCAERLMENGADHNAHEIATRIQAELQQNVKADRWQFRLVTVHREGTRLQQHVTYTSPVYRHTGKLVS